MQNNRPVLKGFISVDDAVAMINRHTASNPLVDMPRMMRGYKYILKGNNFMLHLRKVVGGHSVDAGSVPMTLYDNYDVERLKKALRDKYAEIAGHEFDEVATRVAARDSSVTEKHMDGKPRKSKGMKSAGDEISSGATLSHNDYSSAAGAQMLQGALGE